MRLFFDHIAGKTEDCEIIYAPACAIFDIDEYESALENGWTITTNWYHNKNEWFLEQLEKGETIWYQSRTSRLKVDEFKMKSRHRKRIKKFSELSVDVFNQFDVDVLLGIYQKYLTQRGYIDMYGDKHPFEKPQYGNERYIIVFSYKEKPIAFSIQDVIGNSAVALQFCWDYVNPELGIGTINKYVQLELMKELGVEYMYLGTSYEKNSIKKADYPGFQWWNGRHWSSDKDSYILLCENETRVKTLAELSDLQFHYFAPRKNT